MKLIKGLVLFTFIFSLNLAMGLDTKLSVCDEPQVSTEAISISLKTGAGKSDAKFEDAKPIKLAIELFLAKHAGWDVSEVAVFSSSANTPIEKPRSIKDPKEIKRVDLINKSSNKQLAQVRKSFAEKALADMKIRSTKMEFLSQTLGPEYSYNIDPRKNDGNLKLVVPDFTQDYALRVRELYESHKDDYAKVGIDSADKLLDKSVYKNLWDVKFQPFQGYYVKIKATKKAKCSIKSQPSPASSKQ